MSVRTENSMKTIIHCVYPVSSSYKRNFNNAKFIFFNNQRLISCQFHYFLDNAAEIEEGTGYFEWQMPLIVAAHQISHVRSLKFFSAFFLCLKRI